MMNPEVLPTILLVEDDDVAAEAVVRSLQKHGCHYPVVWAEDGQVALEILRDKDASRVVPRPRVILLDLNMPRMDGFEFLQQLRSDPTLRGDVVFILTTSNADTDRTRAYHECIAGYMVKSAVGPQFIKLVSLLNGYQDAVRFPG